MNVDLRSDKVSLFDYRHTGVGCPDELWQLFRRMAFEPGQAPSPNFASFADECLLCAQIVVNEPTPAQDSTGDTQIPQAIPFPEARANGLSPPPTTSAFHASLYDTPKKDGLIYLHAGPANFSAGEANIGVIMKDSMRGRGYAREAVQLVLRWAFQQFQFHRVQAAILDTPFKDRALRLFIGSGFAYEGTKRRALYQSEGDGSVGVWKDVTYLAMLDTEWAMRATCRPDHQLPERPVISAWDEMFARHAREREELLRWEENHGRVTRSSSTETLKDPARNMAPACQWDLAYLTDVSSIGGEPSLSGSPPSSPPNVVVTWEEDAQMADEGESDADEHQQSWEDVVESTLARRHRQGRGGPHLTLSPLGRLLALPSIPSTAMLSEGNVQSPLTIPSPSSAESTPPSSPSLPPSSTHSSWADSEDEANRLPISPIDASVRSRMQHHPYLCHRTSSASLRRRQARSRSVSSSSTDSWNDAQSSVDGTWDLISNTSDQSRRGRE